MEARLLILAGIVIQLAIFGIGQVSRVAIWAISELAGGAWNIAASLVSLPGLRAIAEFWPLLLVAAGLTILAASKREIRGAVVENRKGVGDGKQ